VLSVTDADIRNIACEVFDNQTPAVAEIGPF
jgi:hypothetical protein